MRRPGSVRSRLGAAVLSALTIAASPTRAATALEIHPPAGFTARQSSPDADAVTTYEVVTTSDPDTGCAIDFAPAQSVARDQAALNAAAAGPGYLDGVKADLAANFAVRSVRPFAMQGADGAMAVADPKAGEGSIRSSIFVVEIPRGKVQVACVASADEYDAWEPVFETVTRGVVLPR